MAKLVKGKGRLGGTGHFAANAHVVSPPRTKHGPRLGGKIKYAQLAILELYGRPVEHVNTRVVQQVNRHLQTHSNPDCRTVCPISPQTIARAAKLLREQ
jgi:hypothetical protein